MESKDTFRDLQFDGKPSGYRDFRRKTSLAVAGLENRHAHLAGPRLLQRLQGEAWRATEHPKIADLRKQNGWLEVIHALELHYRFLPETELHEAVEEFLFSMKRRPGEGATSFSSRFRTQLDRVQTLIAQEREMHRTRKKPKRGRKKRDATDADMPEQPSSSLDESDKSEDPKDPEQAEPATEEEAAPAGATASAAAAGHSTDEAEHSDADVMPYERSVASLTDDGVFHVEPWSTRNAGPVREDLSLQSDDQVGVDTEVLFGEDVDWSNLPNKTIDPEDLEKLKNHSHIQKLSHTYAQFLMTRLLGDPKVILEELSDWLGPQAHKLHETVSLIKVFTGKAPLSDRTEHQCQTSCIRIGLDHGQDHTASLPMFG